MNFTTYEQELELQKSEQVQNNHTLMGVESYTILNKVNEDIICTITSKSKENALEYYLGFKNHIHPENILVTPTRLLCAYDSLTELIECVCDREAAI